MAGFRRQGTEASPSPIEGGGRAARRAVVHAACRQAYHRLALGTGVLLVVEAKGSNDVVDWVVDACDVVEEPFDDTSGGPTAIRSTPE